MTDDLPSAGSAGTSADGRPVHRVPTLPPQGRAGSQAVTHGWVTALRRGSTGVVDWTFFEHLEAAVAFGRAARMSSDVTDWQVHEAATFTRVVDGHANEGLFVAAVWKGLEDADHQAAVLHRWVAGCSPHTTAWVPPEPKPFVRRTGPRDRRSANLTR